MGQVLDEQNVPETGRWFVIPPALAARIKKSDLKQVNFTGDDTSPIRNGKLGMLDRFTLYVSNNLPKCRHGEYTIFGGTRDAISWASQLTKVGNAALAGDVRRPPARPERVRLSSHEAGGLVTSIVKFA
jgi:hypothetical protein